MKIKVIFIAIFCSVTLALCSCGIQDTVSKDEYDKVVAERDNYKQLYEEAIGTGTGDSDADSAEAVRDDSTADSDLELWEVELTTDNVMDYVQIGVYDEKDAFGELNGHHLLITYSKVFKDGWYFYKVSDDFAIEYDIETPEGEEKRTGNSLYTSLMYGGNGDADEYASLNVTVSRVQGSVTFVNQNSVESFAFEDGNREIMFTDGTSSGTSGSGMYEGFPY